MKHIFFLCVFFLNSYLMYSQSIHYYGSDTSFSYYPSDIIRTQDGGLFLIGDVSSSQPFIENYVTRVYLVRTDSTGDTLWTKNYFHDSYGNENVIETNTGEFRSMGSISGGYVCGA